ncbi:MAG: N-acetyltransferase family protein [Methylococcaceae bacterium]
MITIRPAKPSDVAELVELLSELFSIESDFIFEPDKQRQGLQLLLENAGNCILVAELRSPHDNNVVGFCTVQTLISTAEGGRVGLLEDLIIADGYRNQGIGKKLLGEAVRWGENQGLKRLQLLADKSNLPALEFYKKQDWQLTQLICLKYLEKLHNQ